MNEITPPSSLGISKTQEQENRNFDIKLSEHNIKISNLEKKVDDIEKRTRFLEKVIYIAISLLIMFQILNSGIKKWIPFLNN